MRVAQAELWRSLNALSCVLLGDELIVSGHLANTLGVK